MPTKQANKTLVITEKPSVARDFARALDIAPSGDGYFEGQGTVISWALGHLLELWEPHEYSPELKKWKMNLLPILPEKLCYRPVERTKSQLRVLLKLLKRSDIDTIVLATDAGREGELICRLILEEARHGKAQKRPVLRFWTSEALVPEVIKNSLRQMRPLHEYDSLYRAGLARQWADWLIGMNFSRALSLHLKDLYSVGRVQTAVLSLIVDRQKERDEFVPTPFFELKATFVSDKGPYFGTWFTIDPQTKKENTRLEKKGQAQELARSLQGRDGTVIRASREKKYQKPPSLFTLTELQREANRQFGLTAQKTLELAQQLYERHKCLSYPRTDSHVLGKSNLDLVNKILRKLERTYPQWCQELDPVKQGLRNTWVFNDAKLTDHHALIPLAPLPSSAGPLEGKVYTLVLKRFLAAFSRDAHYESTEIITQVLSETFKTQGRFYLSLGWKAIYGQTEDRVETDPAEETLPRVEQGAQVQASKIEVDEKETRPPAPYSEALLLQEMTNPSRYVEEKELKEIYRGDVGLGTQATRAQIIEILLSRGYLVREKKILLPTEKGKRLIQEIRKLSTCAHLASVKETAKWEMGLLKMAQGQDQSNRFLEGIKAFIEEAMGEFKKLGPERVEVISKQKVGMALTGATGSAAASLGPCPICQSPVKERNAVYSCELKERDQCPFRIYKKFLGRLLQPHEISSLLVEGRTSYLQGLRSKKGSVFTAALKLDKAQPSFVSLEFPQRRKKLKRSGLISRKKTYSRRKNSATNSDRVLGPNHFSN